MQLREVKERETRAEEGTERACLLEHFPRGLLMVRLLCEVPTLVQGQEEDEGGRCRCRIMRRVKGGGGWRVRVVISNDGWNVGRG